MSNLIVRKYEKTNLIKPDIYKEFILWTALPPIEKQKLGIETQTAFCEYYKVHINTTTKWKERPDFEKRVDAILKMWSTDKTPDVVYGIYRAAVKGNPMSQMLWLQYFKKFNPKKEEEDDRKKVEYGVNDIRFLISTLPEPLRTKHYGYLRELIEDAQQLRHAGRLEDITTTTVESQGAVSDETDNDAQDVSGKGADEVSCRHTERVCEDMGGKASPYNYQSAARWR